MADGTGIEWTDATWNPTVGCSKVSAGCLNCYAIRQARRQDHPGTAYEGTTTPEPNWSGLVRALPDRLDAPLGWRKPRRVFVDSMSDLFHPSVSEEFIARVFAVMAVARQHTFQVLTKRPERMEAILAERTFWERVHDVASEQHGIVWDGRGSDPKKYHDVMGGRPSPVVLARRRPWPGWPLPNVWLGTSVEHQAAANERIPPLLRTPAAVRFLSCEPLLGPVDLEEWLMDSAPTGGGDYEVVRREGEPRLHWVIVGGESGPGARPCDIAWLRSIVEQCREAGVAVFVKQLGSQPDYERVISTTMGHPEWDKKMHYPWPVKDKKGGDIAEWPEDLRVREFPAVAKP